MKNGVIYLQLQFLLPETESFERLPAYLRVSRLKILGMLLNSNIIIRNDRASGFTICYLVINFFAQSLRDRISSFPLKLGMKAETMTNRNDKSVKRAELY